MTALAPDTGKDKSDSSGDTIDKIWFEDEDEETLKLLLSKTWSNEVPSRLENVAKRFRDDIEPSREESFWQALTASTKDFGFASINSVTEVCNATTISLSEGHLNTMGCPSSFETDTGKKHLRAVASFLSISERRAIQLTMSALRTIYDLGKNVCHARRLQQVLQSLLGTQTLLRQVLDYFYAQRLFRLCIIAECLRIEQDAAENDPFLPHISNLLNLLDASLQLSDGRRRGLFRRLVTIACEPYIPPTLTALAPALDLHPDSQPLRSPPPQEGGFTSDAIHHRWNQFISDCVESSRFQKDLERSEAMEVLLILLYERIQGGAQRDDFVYLLIAFHSLEFFTQLRDGSRLSQQAGLMCAECMGLWRIFSTKAGEYEGSNWVFSHPMFSGMFDISSEASEAAALEIESLQNFLRKLGQHSMERRSNAIGRGRSAAGLAQAPESLALLSFGLFLSQSFESLLRSSEGSNPQAYWQTFRISGIEMAKTAGNEYGALDFLQLALQSLIEARDASPPPSFRSPNTSYDWLLDGASLSAVSLASTKRANAMSIAYSSLGREVLAALVATFRDTILSLHHPGAPANIGMLCDLAAVVYRNEPILCEQFLADWSLYTSADYSFPEELPLCYLMDAASNLAAAAVDDFMSGHVGAENHFFLPSIAPLLRFVSSLSYSSEVVESVLSTLPLGLIRKAFVYSQQYYETSDEFMVNRIRVLDSINTLVRIGESHSCRKNFIRALEVEATSLDGPRLVLKTVEGNDDLEALPYVLSITAAVLQSSHDEPHWAVNTSSLILDRAAAVYLPRIFSTGDPKHLLAAANVLLALSESLLAVVVGQRITESEKSQFVQQILDGVLASLGFLTSTMSSLGQPTVSFSVVEIILRGVCSFMTQLQPILQHESKISLVAAHAREVLINALVSNSNLGEALAYFAVVPISFHIAVLMENACQRERMVDQRLTEELGLPDARNAALSIGRNSLFRTLRTGSLEAMLDLDSLEFDVETWKLRKWIEHSDQDSVFGAASAALEVLRLWASHVENFVADKNGTHRTVLDNEGCLELLMLSPQELLSSLAVAPPTIRRNAALSTLWASMGYSSIELMMRYFRVSEVSAESTLIPTVAVFDLLGACIAHLKRSLVKVEDSALINVLRTSPYIRTIMGEFVSEIHDIIRNSNFQIRPEIHNRLKCCLRALSILPIAVDRELVWLGHREKIDIIQALCDCVREGVELMKRNPMDVLCRDDNLVLRMRLATGCLSIVQAIHKKARAMNSAQLLIEPLASGSQERALFGSLWQVAARFVSVVDVKQWQARTPKRPRSIVLAFFSLVFDIFTTEMAWWSQNKEIASEILDDLFSHGVELTALMHQFSRLSGFEAFLRARKDMRADVGLPFPLLSTAALLAFDTSPSKYLETESSVLHHSRDVLFATRWLASILPDDTDQSALEGKISNFAAAHTVYCNECACLAALARFSGIYISLQDYDGVALARAALQWLCLNAEVVENIFSETGDDLLQTETADIACALAELVLNATTLTASGCGCTSVDAVFGLLVDLSEACGKMFFMLGVSALTSQEMRKKICTTQQFLLASAISTRQALARHFLAAYEQKDAVQRDHVDLALMEVACKVLSLLERLPSADENVSNPFRNVVLTCASLIRTFISNKISSRPTTAALDAFLLRFCQVLREYDVVQFFTLEAYRASNLVVSLSGSTIHMDITYQGEKNVLLLVSTVVDLLLVIVESRHSDLLSLFSQGRTAELITRNPLIAYVSNAWNRNEIHQRGYLPSRALSGQDGNRNGVARDDPIHALWISILQTMKSLVCISNATEPGDQNSEYFVELAVSFINANKVTICSCLNSCAVRPLSLNVLKEASSILSLLLETCASVGRNRIHPILHHDIASALTGAVPCLSNLLGASGAAHELFNVLECLETSGEVWDTPTSINASLQLTHPLLTAGVPNARHEGIRYAHFASQSLAVMTQGDYKDSSTLTLPEQSREKEPQSPSSIERRGRSSINSAFHGRMEKAAAECLVRALLVILRLHPASSSVVKLSPEAVGRSDTWPLVKPGMLIAYRCLRPENMIRVARVLHVDTIHRAWHVRVLRSGLEEAIERDENVQLHQVVGIENLDKRKSIFQYLPAPDSAAELEQSAISNPAMTLGHLILVLRWCQNQKQSFAASNSWVRHLAEVTVAILGAEISLYREIGAGDCGITTVAKRIDEQLFNIFGDENVDNTELNAERDVLHQSRGPLPLGDVLSSAVWKVSRTQLGPELRQARIEADAKRRRQTEITGAAPDGGIGFSGSRRNSSAFRGLRVPLE